MALASIWIGLALAATGAALVAAARRPLVDAASVLAELDRAPDQPLDELSERLAVPFAPRLLIPAGQRVGGWIRGMLPGNYLDRVRRRLVVSGLADRVRAEEFVALQLIGLAAGALAGLVLGFAFAWGPAGILRAVAVCAGAGALAPVQWVQKSRERRTLSMRRDLPDVLDLLAISVEAGLGLEGALEVVCRQFDTPLAHELGRMLREMELGVPRRQGLQNLKRRIDVPEVSQFVLSLIQADALGMPLGKVLRVQAHEMRQKRRMWARERAAKLPVKIIFPLVLLILPALFVVVLGPAVMSIAKNIVG